MIESILIIVFLVLFIHYVIFLSKIYFGLSKLTNKVSEKIPEEFVSIIVPFRNEESNILNTYLSLTSQNYPKEKFEILFINDSSDDNSLQIIENLSKKENVFIYSVPKDYSVNAHKKRAIRFGIEKSKGEIIVTTDADCNHKKNWLNNLLNFMDKETGFISG
ncbi:MAG: glycosyltransferase, partial [Ignavibacteriaceae bacterium]